MFSVYVILLLVHLIERCVGFSGILTAVVGEVLRSFVKSKSGNIALYKYSVTSKSPAIKIKVQKYESQTTLKEQKIKALIMLNGS